MHTETHKQKLYIHGPIRIIVNAHHGIRAVKFMFIIAKSKADNTEAICFIFESNSIYEFVFVSVR